VRHFNDSDGYGCEFASKKILGMIENSLAECTNLSERNIAIFVEQLENKQFHLGLIDIDRIPDSNIIDFSKVLHRTIP